MNKLLVNAVLFQAGWFACVFAASQSWLLAVPLLVLLVHFLWTCSWRAEGRLVASVMLFGCVLDTFLLNLGVLDFGSDSPLLPAWMALLWALLGTTLNHSLRWSATPWWRASLLGALGGSLSYLGGGKLAGVSFPHGETATLILLALIWAGVLPLLHGFARLYRQDPSR
ncbi:DUF2878 domain-containing protein [Pseudomonas sp. N040]|uniref:DUF2878 domain-containing protein n=1 Tax=Pseudomonas sp. N040 TaxID=2785325 RepID=UPI0018A257CE|nr:DUF2878 domain-containing protein [Pseudomonas sp. N040]MBF7730553.1 DUF2878 domain-containing protein [Pseudomonas sp. N040]MBW7014197.1 DUF2878 domain-containing protein [Pseudomonas sp. N040]